ncbi:head-tail connector protein [Thalassobacillus sp. C254]|uniref:head-tail connector protein n=1 Tax=Thalassobacillus sp. C254 TaxID=1225341 RepID=UPI0006D01EB5|nr:head-tail connector protein [Thalassobacillus sp. C254]
MDLQHLKTYLRIDGSEDDQILTSFVNAAKGHLNSAGVKKPLNDDEHSQAQYDLAIMLYVKREYDPLTQAELERIEKSLEGIILQLRDYGGVENE